jgi:class 3 adenylate cyclase
VPLDYGGCRLGESYTRSMGEARKVVTVVFADVTGSTRLGERLDPEALRRVMERYFGEMRSILEQHGGTVEKFIGDAVMAAFGIRVAHEDDALRAVKAASDMHVRLTELNEELARERGVTLAVRTGINTGEVVVGDPSSGWPCMRTMSPATRPRNRPSCRITTPSSRSRCGASRSSVRQATKQASPPGSATRSGRRARRWRCPLLTRVATTQTGGSGLPG